MLDADTMATRDFLAQVDDETCCSSFPRPISSAISRASLPSSKTTSGRRWGDILPGYSKGQDLAELVGNFGDGSDEIDDST